MDWYERKDFDCQGVYPLYRFQELIKVHHDN